MQNLNFQIETIVKNLMTALESWYKIKTSWQSNFGTVDQIQKILAYSITQQPINNLDDNSPVEGRSWRSLMVTGAIYVICINSSFRIIWPPIVASMLSDSLYLFEIDILFPVKAEWNWKVFEEHEPYIDAVKTNLLISAGYTEIEISKLYSEFCSPPLKSKRVQLQNLTVAKETSQFLPMRSYTISSDKGNFRFDDDDLYKYSFLCQNGNPSIDSHVFRKCSSDETNDLRPWMICKQTKHSIESSTLTGDYLEGEFKKWQKFREPFNNKFRVPYILFSNRNCSRMDVESFVNKHAGVMVICRANLNSYLPTVLSCFAYFDDVESVLKEDFIPDASTNSEIEDDELLSELESYED